MSLIRDLSRKILSIGAISSIFKGKFRYTYYFIVVIEMALSGISYNFSIFPKKLSPPAKKKI